jgi:predicted MPP superfamily phosphohydrolase
MLTRTRVLDRLRAVRLGAASVRLGAASSRLRAVLRRVAHPRLLAVLGVLLVAGTGAVLGARLAPSTQTEVGPLQVQVRVILTADPGVRLLLPPAGQVQFTTHRAPFAVEGSISQVDLEGARALIDSPSGIRTLSDSAIPALKGAAVRAALTTLLFGGLGAAGLAFLVYRFRWWRLGQVALTLTGALAVTSAMTLATADPARLAQPQFSGLLSQAPYIAGQVPTVIDRLESYRTGLADIVRSVTALYATTGDLPVVPAGDGAGVVTVLHVSDIHLNPLAYDLIERLVTQFRVDVVIDTGDITTWGTEVESSTLSRISDLQVPYVFVRGNHDSAATAAAVAANPNAIVLSNQVRTVAGLTIAGIGDPIFTPDSPADVAAATGSPSPAVSPSPSVSPSPAVTARAPDGQQPDPSQPDQVQAVPSGPQAQNNRSLAQTIENWSAARPNDLVEIAAVHEPVELDPLLGRVGTILAGHTHSRTSRLDPTGTRIMVEGSTGGAGITARGLDRLANGQPLPLAASLVYLARTGPRAGRVVATDSITVGGFGLASVNLQRQVFQDDKPLEPGPAPSRPPSPAISVTASRTASQARRPEATP